MATKKRRGKFIVIEGGDGSGKTTMVALARELYGTRSDVLITREPGGSPYAEMIRQVILKPEGKNADANTMFSLFWASRADHMKHYIRPKLESNGIVIADRFDASSYAYQIFGQENMQLKDLFWHMRDVYLNEIVPDLYIYLDVSPEEGVRRIALRKGEGKNHLDDREISFHKRVRDGYHDFLKNVPHVIIDAGGSLESVKTEFARTLREVLE